MTGLPPRLKFRAVASEHCRRQIHVPIASNKHPSGGRPSVGLGAVLTVRRYSDGARSSTWTERPPAKREVAGSSPAELWRRPPHGDRLVSADVRRRIREFSALTARSRRGPLRCVAGQSGGLHAEAQAADIHGMEALLSVRDVAALLGVSRAQVYRYVEVGLPCVRLSGRVLRFRPTDVQGWVDELASAHAADPAVASK